jgi:predicted MFS family arabinose efflux permease
VTSVALPLTAVLLLHASALSVATITAAGSLPALVIGLPSGAYVTRLPLRGTQIGMDLLRAAAIAWIPVASSLGVLSIVQMIAVAAVVGAGNVIFSVANATMIPELVPAEELTKRNSLIFGSRGIAQLAGPGLGGVLVEALGAASCMLVDAGSYLISAVTLWRLPASRARVKRQGQHPPIRQQIVEGIVYVRSRPALRITLVLQVCVNLTGAAILALSPLYLVRGLHQHAFVIGLLYATEGGGALAGAAVTTRLSARWGTAGVLLRCTLPVPLTVLLLAASFSGWGAALFGLGIFAFAATLTVIGIVIQTYRHRVVPTEMLPRLVATTGFFGSGGRPLGALVAGGLGALLGVHVALYVIALASVAVPACVWLGQGVRGGFAD